MSSIRPRPRIDFTAEERRTELALLRDLQTAKKFRDVNTSHYVNAVNNLNELYDMVENRYRSGK